MTQVTFNYHVYSDDGKKAHARHAGHGCAQLALPPMLSTHGRNKYSQGSTELCITSQ